MARGSYVIEDEPVSGGPTRQRLIVEPLWPLLAVMLAGVWIGWPWLLFNAIALGAAQWRQQARLLLIGLVGTALLAGLIVALLEARVITRIVELRVALLAVTVWKLGITYRVQAMQLGTVELYRHYGGTPRSGGGVLVLAMLLSPALFGWVKDLFWIIILHGGLTLGFE